MPNMTAADFAESYRPPESVMAAWRYVSAQAGKRGEYSTTLAQLAYRFNWHTEQVDDFLWDLRAQRFIDLRFNKSVLIIRVARCRRRSKVRTAR
jgi:hypothetical protein